MWLESRRPIAAILWIPKCLTCTLTSHAPTSSLADVTFSMHRSNLLHNPSSCSFQRQFKLHSHRKIVTVDETNIIEVKPACTVECPLCKCCWLRGTTPSEQNKSLKKDVPHTVFPEALPSQTRFSSVNQLNTPTADRISTEKLARPSITEQSIWRKMTVW